MQLLDSHVEAGQELGERDRQAYYTALVEYLYFGVEPKLTGAAKAVFVAIRPTLDNSISRSKSGSKGGSKRASKTEANVQANKNQNTENRASYQDSPSPYSSPSNPLLGSDGCNPSREGVQGEGFSAPSLEEARAYFEANGLMGDPEAFWAHYDSQGWLKGNGLPVSSWHSLAVRWGIEERAREASKPPDQQRKPVPKPVNLADDTLEEDIAEFERRYGVRIGG